ncbi:hypothetical protein PSU4_55410 [Pseudonocardia sulfidoxydans NBRC 16205]|uniref:DUF5134 domain-containing protein n=2 Tax=Pseudonocardia sulfidoxydans TaxID=54011 RepID=A0A511DQF7_9PSEU|nr:DUF5134 domain-containing protein [Pseudonocardia sulfidoxydans]GEL26587.1 hypothetical protein PSU4_55410 [Pseudonocardia sulfidoxydans NBRC 16205]
MEWVHVILAVGCLGLGVLHLARLLLMRGDRVGEASHAAMGVGMAAMYSPLGDPVPDAVWLVVFAATGLWFAALAVRAGLGTRDAGYHVVCAVAMVFMLTMGGHDAAGGHGGHGGIGLLSVAALALAGFFAWHALRCGDRLVAAARGDADCACEPAAEGLFATVAPPVATRSLDATPEVGRLARLRSARTATGAHIAMAGAMTVMCLGML